MAAQFAAEETLRRVHAAHKDDDMPPIETILAPLEAELKVSRQEVIPSLTSSVFVFVQMSLIGFHYHYQIFHSSPVTSAPSNYPYQSIMYLLRTKYMTS
jgi:hypothetical protein